MVGQFEFNGYLLKPISKVELFAQLKRFLQYRCTEEEQTMEIEQTIPVLDAASLNRIYKLSELIIRIDEEVLPLFEKLKKRQPVKQTKKFGTLIKKMGEEHNFNLFTQFGDKLLEYIDHFQIAEMRIHLKQLHEIIEPLKLIE